MCTGSFELSDGRGGRRFPAAGKVQRIGVRRDQTKKSKTDEGTGKLVQLMVVKKKK